MKAKICGLTTTDAIASVIENGADYAGFVFFAKSPRNLTPKKYAELAKNIPATIKKVGVFVNASNDEISAVMDKLPLDYLQCHGSENIDRIYDLHVKFAIPVIKAVAVRSSDDIALGKKYEDTADMLLFDAKIPTSPIPGGNGLAFDWTLLKGRNFQVPWLLSGGLNMQNIEEAVRITGARAVDVSSSLESEPGIKDPELIAEFLKKVKSL